MKVTAENLSTLDSRYPGYLEGGIIDRFFDEYGINFSAGHWCAGGFSDRFCKTYNETPLDESAVGQIQRVAQAGIKGVELNNEMCLDDHLNLSQGKVNEIKQALEQFRVIPTNMNTNIWTRAKYKLGGITHPDPGRRREALDYCLQVVDCARATGCPSVQLWPGSDGWDYHFEVN